VSTGYPVWKSRAGIVTPEERRAINALKRLAKTWPKTLWIFAAPTSRLNVMRCGANGEHVETPPGDVDPAYVVDCIEIDSDGGGW